MAYTVLARKYRSQSFDDVVGQGPIAQTLKNAIKTDKVAHAYLFAGTRGIGKTTMARILAKALNCLSVDLPTVKPCCKCESCVAINTGEDIDVIEIDGASNRGIDNIRELRENAIYRPARSRYKIYVIDEVHMLTTEAFNALLKTLEEPPAHIKFIFATTEPNKVIATVQSRCQRFDFKNINAADIAAQLKNILQLEKIKYEEALLLPLAKMANGSMRDGLSLLDRLISAGSEPLTCQLLEEFLGCPNAEKVWQLIAQIGNSDAEATLQAAEDLLHTGLNEVQIVGSLAEYMRDLMVIKSAGKDTELLILAPEQRKRAAEVAEKFDIAALVYNITTLEKLRWQIKNSESGRALLEAALLRFALSEHFLNVDAVLQKLDVRSSAGLKKKSTDNNLVPKPSKNVTVIPIDKQKQSFVSDNIESVRDNWESILNIVGERLGKGTAGLLSSAKPACFANEVLTLAFGASDEMSKNMCESNGKKEALEALFVELFSKRVRVECQVVAGNDAKSADSKAKTSSEKTNEIMNDPAVKIILKELGATITNIEEKQ